MRRIITKTRTYGFFLMPTALRVLMTGSIVLAAWLASLGFLGQRVHVVGRGFLAKTAIGDPYTKSASLTVYDDLALEPDTENPKDLWVKWTGSPTAIPTEVEFSLEDIVCVDSEEAPMGNDLLAYIEMPDGLLSGNTFADLEAGVVVSFSDEQQYIMKTYLNPLVMDDDVLNGAACDFSLKIEEVTL